MIERNQNVGPETSEKVEDKAVRNFRKIIDSKKPEEREEEKTSVFSYAATVCLALAVLATGVAFFQNRQKSSGIPEDVATASAVIAQITPEEAETNSTDASENFFHNRYNSPLPSPSFRHHNEKMPHHIPPVPSASVSFLLQNTLNVLSPANL